MQVTEQRHAGRIVGVSGSSCACRGGREPGPASTGESPDDSVEFPEFGDAVDIGGDAAGIVAQSIAGILADGREHAFEMRLDAPSMQSPGQPAAPRPRRPQVVQAGARRRAEEQPAEKRPIIRRRRRPPARPQYDPRQFYIGTAPRYQAYGAVERRLKLQSGAVGYQCPGEVAGDDVPQVAAHEDLGLGVGIPRIQARGELAQAPLGDAAGHLRTDGRTRDEGLGHRVDNGRR